jgi:L-lactate dehydrogenase complex protein LldG
LVDQFERILEGQSASVKRVSDMNHIPEIVAVYLRDHNLPARIRHGSDDRLATIDWSRAAHIDRLPGPANPVDAVGLSHAFAGASETGTLFLVSGEANPTTINFLPETHIVVIRAGEIVGPYEDAWSHIRKVYGERTMPRTINMISGPSRTGDIEQTIIMGAHGPKRMLVIIVEDV